jgi:hypothetical protein
VDVRAAEARAREQRSSRGGFGSSLSANSMASRGSNQRSFDVQRKTGGEVTGPRGPSGIEPARSRVRAEVFYQWPARLVSAGVSACKATDHARAS